MTTEITATQIHNDWTALKTSILESRKLAAALSDNAREFVNRATDLTPEQLSNSLRTSTKVDAVTRVLSSADEIMGFGW